MATPRSGTPAAVALAGVIGFSLWMMRAELESSEEQRSPTWINSFLPGLMDKFTNSFNRTFNIDTSVEHAQQQPMQPRPKVLGKNPRDAMTKAAARRRQEQEELEAFSRANGLLPGHDDNESRKP